MRNLKNNKAAGTDGIHLELIKYGGIKLLNRMYELIRQIWEEERIPEEWKEIIRVPIYKKGDRPKCQKNRGTASGNAANKILVNIILEKYFVNIILEKYFVIHAMQLSGVNSPN